MYMSTCTPEQIHDAIRQANAGAAVPDLCRRLGVSGPTFARWQRQYGGLDLDELRELRELRDEVRRLKRTISDLTADKRALSVAISRMW